MGAGPSWEVPGNRVESRPLFDSLRDEEESWSVSSELNVRVEESMDAAIESAHRTLASRVRRELGACGGGGQGATVPDPSAASSDADKEPVEGGLGAGIGADAEEAGGHGPGLPGGGDCSIFVAPAFAPGNFDDLKNLDEFRAALQAEEEKRLTQASRTESPIDDGPAVINGIDFDSLSLAKSYAEQRRSKLESEESWRFCKELSEGIANSLPPLDDYVIHPVNAVDAELADRLAAGLRSTNLANQPDLVQELRRHGIQVLVMPYFENQGSHYAIRGRIVNLSRPHEVGQVYVTIGSNHHESLQEKLSS